MQLLVAEMQGHSLLEVVSWTITIIAFGLVVLQLGLYWFGRNVPLQIRAGGEVTTQGSGEIMRIVVEFRSRTRDTQTVREVLLFTPPSWFVRTFWPRWYRKERDVTPALGNNTLPITIDGHDTRELVVAFSGNHLPYGRKTRLKVRASRRRPHVARVRLHNAIEPGAESTKEAVGEPEEPHPSPPRHILRNALLVGGLLLLSLFWTLFARVHSNALLAVATALTALAILPLLFLISGMIADLLILTRRHIDEALKRHGEVLHQFKKAGRWALFFALVGWALSIVGLFLSGASSNTTVKNIKDIHKTEIIVAPRRLIPVPYDMVMGHDELDATTALIDSGFTVAVYQLATTTRPSGMVAGVYPRHCARIHSVITIDVWQQIGNA